jgi:hypothetical protein
MGWRVSYIAYIVRMPHQSSNPYFPRARLFRQRAAQPWLLHKWGASRRGTARLFYSVGRHTGEASMGCSARLTFSEVDSSGSMLSF